MKFKTKKKKKFKMEKIKVTIAKKKEVFSSSGESAGFRLFGTSNLLLSNAEGMLLKKETLIFDNFILDNGFSKFLSLPKNHKITKELLKMKSIRNGKPHKIKRFDKEYVVESYMGIYIKFSDGINETNPYGPIEIIVTDSDHGNVGIMTIEEMLINFNPKHQEAFIVIEKEVKIEQDHPEEEKIEFKISGKK